MLLAIRSGMFMPKAHNMTEFVNNNAKFITIAANGNGLWSIATFANEGTTSMRFKPTVHGRG